MAGDWSASSLPDVLEPFARTIDSAVPRFIQFSRALLSQVSQGGGANTIERARRNAAHHYDLSNDLFSLFLDDSLSYSCAWFQSERESLGEAQIAKMDAVLDLAQVGEGTRLLEIGGGWGALAVRAARRGAVVTSLNVSQAQLSFAQRRASLASGLAVRPSFLNLDYREVGGEYDAVVSVEMIESVGRSNLPDYFRAVDRVLKEGGRAVFQLIHTSHLRMLATGRANTWSRKYTFPDGEVLSLRAVSENVGNFTGLRLLEKRDLSSSYVRTLQAWRRRFIENADLVLDLGFDSTFMRMWDLYLSGSEAGFRCGDMQVVQLSYVKDR